MPGENELGLAQLLQNFAPGNNTCSNNERLRDGGVFNGFFFGFSAVVDQVNTRRIREPLQMLTHPVYFEPGAQKALLLGALTGAYECTHRSPLCLCVISVCGAL